MRKVSRQRARGNPFRSPGNIPGVGLADPLTLPLHLHPLPFSSIKHIGHASIAALCFSVYYPQISQTIYFSLIKSRRMSLDCSSKSSEALKGIHGVKLVHLWPVSARCEDFDISTSTSFQNVLRSPTLIIPQIWQQRPSFLRPVHCSIQGDQSIVETVANVLTSLPFIILGLQTPRKNLNSVLYANSLIGVGVASCLYHSSRGQVRRFFRWADYTMIATSTVCLSRTLSSENRKLLMAASAMFLPFQPLMVSAIHTGMMEVTFAKKASTKPELRTAHSLHAMSSLLGGILFVADELFPETPYIHAAWHLAAAVGVGTCNKLLE